ncbi:MAG: hypothetical protein QOE90_1516 [Thermoplasmata archaeon]|jgi:hypothetical protein|nr:hypothetical protein [Thermoplasmata archaeon]
MTAWMWTCRTCGHACAFALTTELFARTLADLHVVEKHARQNASTRVLPIAVSAVA